MPYRYQCAPFQGDTDPESSLRPACTSYGLRSRPSPAKLEAQEMEISAPTLAANHRPGAFVSAAPPAPNFPSVTGPSLQS